MKSRYTLAIVASILVVGFGLALNAQVITQPSVGPAASCAYNASPPTLTSGLAGWVQCDVSGNLRITGTVAATAGASATGGYSFLNIAAGQATTVVKASAGTLHTVTLNSAATATNTTVIYDNATGVGTVIARPNVVAATVPTTLVFDLAFAAGLTIITATANGGDMTVTYK